LQTRRARTHHALGASTGEEAQDGARSTRRGVETLTRQSTRSDSATRAVEQAAGITAEYQKFGDEVRGSGRSSRIM